MSGQRIIEGLEQALDHARGDRSVVDPDTWLEDVKGRADFHREPREVRHRDREWRAERQAADRPPPSDKVVHPRVLVALPPRVKKGKVTSR